MLLAVYGTLREGDYNHYRLGDKAKFLSQERVMGFQMYHIRGAYPYVVRDSNASVLVEVYDVDDGAYEGIKRMEVGAGYAIADIDTSIGVAKLFYFTENTHQSYQKHSRCPKILNGDWFEWLRKFAPERLEKNESIIS